MKLWEENSIKSYYRVLPSFVWSRVLVVVFVSLTDVLLFVSLFFFAGFSFTGWYFVDVHQRPLMACDWTTSRRVVLRRRRRRSRPPRIRPAVLVSFSMFCFVFFGPTPPSRTPETHTHTHTHTHPRKKKKDGRLWLLFIGARRRKSRAGIDASFWNRTQKNNNNNNKPTRFAKWPIRHLGVPVLAFWEGKQKSQTNKEESAPKAPRGSIVGR